MATVSEVAVTKFAPLLGLLADVPDPRRAQGQIYKLPHVLLFSILAIVTGANSYRGIVTFIDVNRRKLNATFGLTQLEQFRGFWALKMTEMLGFAAAAPVVWC